MDLAKPKRAVSTASTSIVTRSRAAATQGKEDLRKFAFTKRKAVESPLKMLNKKTVFKDLTNREAVKDPSTYVKFQNDNVAAAAKKLAKTKISESNKTNKQVLSKVKSTRGQVKSEGVISTYFKVTKNLGRNGQHQLQTVKKPEAAEHEKEIKEKPVLAPVTECSQLPVVLKENVEPPGDSNIARASCSSRDSTSPLYVTALEEISSTETECAVPYDPVLDPTVPPKRDLPPGVTDFDAENWTDPFQVSNYATEIFNYFKNIESNFRIAHYINEQPDLTTGMRTVVVDWMVELQETFELNHETLYLAVKVLDSYLSKVPVKRNLLQLVAATSIFIASKYDERFPPSIEDHLYVCEGAYTKRQLMAMEINILKLLDFKLGFPISYRFLRRYARFGDVKMPTLTLARYILEYSLMDYFLMSESDSKLAASALLLALKMKGSDEWSPNLQYASGYSIEDLKDTTTRLNNMLNRAVNSGSKLTAVKNKYSHKIFFEVAKLPLLNKLEF